MVRRAFTAATFFCVLVFSGVARPDSNQLSAEASPYLQIHATDPVHWRAWSDATLTDAKKAGRPILLSIGYSACHWCHVMQRESFANPAIAAKINAKFFPILIDREERPDLDVLFQSTAALLDLPTGWPLTAFLTPEAQVYFSGTYFPGEARQGMPGFGDVLDRVAEAFAKDPKGVRENAALIKQIVIQSHRPSAGEITSKHRAAAAAAFMADADTLSGGFGQASKFPEWAALSFLWRHHLRTGSEAAAAHLRMSLKHMVRGGLTDHAGGGFFRYATDPQWQVPHFEKMLDVNGGLLGLLTQVWRETDDPELAHAVTKTVAFLSRDMQLPGGAFATSLDADSRDADGTEREGAFYRWRRDEIVEALAGKADGFLEIYAIAPLTTPPGAEEDDPENGTLVREDAEARPEELKILHRRRSTRHPPYRDEKILADWNGLAVAGLAEAGLAFGKPDWIGLARSAFDHARRALSDPNGRLHQSAVGTRRGPLATLSGLTAMTGAAISLFEATGNAMYLNQALTWAAAIETYHGDKAAGGFYDSAGDAAATPVRLKTIIDDPNPSGNASAAMIAARLYYHTGDSHWQKMASRTLTAHGRAVVEPHLGMASLLNAADTFDAALQVVIIGHRDQSDTRDLLAGVMARSLPAQILQIVAPGTVLPEGHPARYKEQIDGKATVYVCRGTVCSLPATERAELDATLVSMRQR